MGASSVRQWNIYILTFQAYDLDVQWIIKILLMSSFSKQDSSMLRMRNDDHHASQLDSPGNEAYNLKTIQTKSGSLNPEKLKMDNDTLEPNDRTLEQQKSASNLNDNNSNILFKQKDRYLNSQMQRNMLNTDDSVPELRVEYSHQKLPRLDSQSKIKRKAKKLTPISSIMKNQNVKVFQQQNSASEIIKRTVSPQKKRVKAIRVNDINENAKFIRDAIPKNKKLVAVLKRNKDGLKRLFPQYDLFLNEELHFIMSSKRKPCFGTSTYHISSKIEAVNQLEEQYNGTVSSNFSGSIWNLEDNSFGSQNKIIATISYQNQIMCSTTPRNLQIFMMSPYYTYEDIDGANLRKNLKQLYAIGSNKQNKRILKFINKKPEWSEPHQAWAMDFHGKALIPSVKNMILVDALDERTEVMLLTKAGDNSFNFQTRFPLSPRIAMAIVNSSFDFKWVCQ